MVPALKVLAQRLGDAVSELIKLAPSSNQYITQLNALKLSVQSLNDELDPS